MTRRLFLKLAALLAVAPLVPRLAWADGDYWILDVSALGVGTRLAAPDTPIFRLWVPYAGN